MIRISEYATLPLLDVRRGFALGVALVTATPKDAPEPVKQSVRVVHAATKALQADWAARERAENHDRRPVDLRNDRAWGALSGALTSAAVLVNTARGKAAAELIPRLFGNGLAFTQLPYERQWSEGARLLEEIEREGLEPQIDLAVGGPEYLAELRESHAEYGAALNITAPASQKAEVNLTEALGGLRDAINVHVSQVIAWGNQSASVEGAARAALEPIDKARAQEGARSSGKAVPGDEPEVTPETPVPAVP